MSCRNGSSVSWEHGKFWGWIEVVLWVTSLLVLDNFRLFSEYSVSAKLGTFSGFAVMIF